MIRTRVIIAQRLGGIVPQKDGARIVDTAEIFDRVFAADLQVLRGQAVCKGDGLLHGVADKDRPVILERLLHDLAALELRGLAFQLFGNLFRKAQAGREQNRRGQHVMLRLRKQIRGKVHRVRRFVRQNKNLARPRDHVDVHDAVQLFFCRGHINIARANDLVHPRDGLGAIGQRRRGLRSAHQENAVHSGDQRRRHDIGIRPAVLLGRRRHNDLAHLRDFRRDCVHQNGRGVCRRATGDVNADTMQPAHPLAHQNAVLAGRQPALLRLTLVKIADVLRGPFQSGDKFRVAVFGKLCHLLAIQLAFGGQRAVEPQGVFFHGRVAAGSDLFQNLRNAGVDQLILFFAAAADLFHRAATFFPA